MSRFYSTFETEVLKKKKEETEVFSYYPYYPVFTKTIM